MVVDNSLDRLINVEEPDKGWVPNISPLLGLWKALLSQI